jgi:putative DNA primase/helicase
MKHDIARWDPAALAERLGLVADAVTDAKTPNASAVQRQFEFVDLGLYPELAEALDIENSVFTADGTIDRSETTMKVVRACAESRMSVEQSRWVIDQRVDLAARVAEFSSRTPPVDDVLACFLKADSSMKAMSRSMIETPFESPSAASPPGVEHTAHLGMAIKLADKFVNQLIFVHGIGWHFWDEKRWAADHSGVAMRKLHALLRSEWVAASRLSKDERATRAAAISRCETATGMAGVLTAASALQEFSVQVDQLDADPYLLNCSDWTYDLRDGTYRHHDPADRITKVTRAACRTEAIDVTWTPFLEKVLPDEEIRNYLRRVIGVALLGKVIEHILVILTGVGSNGKGTFYKALNFAFGDYADMADPELFMDRKGAHPTGDMALRGRRLVVVSESGRDRALDEARMKRLVGGDTIMARLLYHDFVTFEPSHLALFVTNHLPKVAGDDQAVWRRLRVALFDVVITEQDRDKHLEEKLEAEADAILAWAIAGWRDYRDRDEKLCEPPAVLVATRNYRTASDDVGRFLDDEDWCLKAPTLKATTGKLHERYLRWASQEGADDMALKSFGQALDVKGYPVTTRTSAGRWRDGLAPSPVGDGQ